MNNSRHVPINRMLWFIGPIPVVLLQQARSKEKGQTVSSLQSPVSSIDLHPTSILEIP